MTNSCKDGKVRSGQEGVIKLGRAITIISGAPFKSELFNDVGNGLPLIRVRDVNTGPAGIFYSGDYQKEHLVTNGDLLISMDGDFKAIRWSYGDGLLNQRVCKIVPRENVLYKHYLEQFLPKALSDIHRETTFTTVKHLSTKTIKEIEIPLPPLDDQKRIAHLLGKVEGLIARRKHHLQQLDDLLKSVFLEMFGDPVRNEKGWYTVPFHKVGKFISGGTPSKSRDDFWIGDFPWVSPKDMKVAKIGDATDHISDAVFDETSLKRVTPGHLLIVVRGMILAHSFPVAINTVEIAINQDMKAIKPTKDVNVVYLQSCLTALKRQILKSISTAGHGTRKFDSIAMQKLYVPQPPIDLQNQFAAIAEKVESLKSRYQQSLTDLETLYGALSQKAFKGELDLSRVVLPVAATTEDTESTEGLNRQAPQRCKSNNEVAA